MDTIWNCAFGLDIDLQHNPQNPYFVNCEKVFASISQLNLPSYLGSKNFVVYSLVHTIFRSKILIINVNLDIAQFTFTNSNRIFWKCCFFSVAFSERGKLEYSG